MGLFELIFGKSEDPKEKFYALRKIAINLFEQKEYEEALKAYEVLIPAIPHGYPESEKRDCYNRIAECNYYLGNYKLFLDSIYNKSEYSTYDKQREWQILSRALSYQKLGESNEALKHFKQGIAYKYKSVIEEYIKYFGPVEYKLLCWNNLHENTKYLLCKNIKFNFIPFKTKLTELEIDLIISCKNLDLSCRKEGWNYDTFIDDWRSTSSKTEYIIHSLYFCKYLPNIEKLNISGQPIVNFEGLENHSNIIEIDASYSSVNNLEALRNCNKLINLNLYCIENKDKKFLDIEPISNLGIVKLDLTQNTIVDFNFLNIMKTLKFISLSNTNIESLSQIKNLSELELLIVIKCKAFKLSNDGNFPNLKTLRINCKPTNEEKYLFKEKHPNCIIDEKSVEDEIFRTKTRLNPDQVSGMLDYYSSM